MKNKVCIVTWFGGTNYGTNLQAYALLEELRLLGYDPRMKGSITGNINYLLHPNLVLNRIFTRFKLKLESKKGKVNIANKLKQQKFTEFCNEYFPLLNSHGKKEWNEVEKEYIAFITGSDQVWNPNYFQSMMMLDFVKSKKIKKIAYAPSIGVSKLSYLTRRKYKRLLSSYSAIAMREQKATKILSDISPVKVKTVLDPTLLLDCDNWNKIADKAEIDDYLDIGKPYVLCYFVGNRKSYADYIRLVKTETGLNCVIIPMEIDLSDCGTVARNIGPKEFVFLIKNAEIICTDSFHATVFSILYKKEFYVLKRFDDNSKKSQNGRLDEILETYGLGKRYIKDEKSFERNKNIDYNFVHNLLNENRKFSQEYLRESLER